MLRACLWGPLVAWSIPLRPNPHSLLGAEAQTSFGADEQPKSILWAENTTEFIVGLVLVVLAATATWFFERQLARFECLLSIGMASCVPVNSTEAVAENNGQLVHLSGQLRPNGLEDPRFDCAKLGSSCTQLRTQVQVYQRAQGVFRWESKSLESRTAVTVGSTLVNASEVRLGDFIVSDLIDQCKDLRPAAKLIGSEVRSHKGLCFQQHSDGFFYWRSGGGWTAEQVAKEPKPDDLRAKFEATVAGKATALALQAADVDTRLLPFRLLSPFTFGEERQLRVLEARKSRVNLAVEDQVCPHSFLCCGCNFVAGCCAGVATPEIFRLFPGHRGVDSCFAELRKTSQLDVGLGVWSFRLLVLALLVAGFNMSFSEAFLHLYPVMSNLRVAVARMVVSVSISLALVSAMKGVVFIPYKLGKAFIYFTLACFFGLFPLIVLC